MEQSLFIQYVNKYFPGVTVRVTETLNGTANPAAQSYLHRRMLRPEFSVSGKWESISSANSLVMADVVAMDSSLPLKKRDTISKANGDIPKMGMELKLNEKQLTDLDTLIAQKGSEADIVAKLFADTKKAIGGVYERNEEIFLQGLSTGIALVEDTENVGTGIRVDFGIAAANKFGVTTLWSNVASKPFDDIQRVVDKANADGNSITRVFLDDTAFNNLAKTTQAKELFAFSQGFVGATIPTPDMSQVNRLATSRYGFEFEKVSRSVKYEKNGVQTAVKPWADGAVSFVCGEQVGTLTYARLAEQNHPVENVSYQTVEDFILVSKYRLNKPSLSEHTTSQARVLPVIANVDQIYLLDSKTLQA